ncbi:Glu-tRNA(Gln) amidotransferase GatDE subunit D [Candidatus Woesearchaeota archaeon]|nr:MAG: Glu-tRNA(Gln) amidotransferase GatDE subunit D [Candidatus Woesearchaeota archaeon]
MAQKIDVSKVPEYSKVKVKSRLGAHTGIVLPSPADALFLKLDNGYNVGISKSSIESLEIVEPKKEKSSKPEKSVVKKKKGLPSVHILHTGGTIASKVDYSTGGVIAQFSPEELVGLFPEVKSFANIESRLVANIQSEMMRFGHYNILGEAILEEAKKGADAIIITHGTDTLHYTAAALEFALQNLSIPVLLVGAQRSSDRGSSDAALNLINAVYFASKSDFAGVAVVMHESTSDDYCHVLPATKCRKMHTSRRDAFRPINALPYARVNFRENKIEKMSDYPVVEKGKTLEFKPFKPDIKVGIIKSHTNMYAEQFLAYKGFDGLILEGTGLGHIPTFDMDEHSRENAEIKKAVLELISSGTIIFMASQTIYGRVSLTVYSPQRELREMGVLGHLSDMTPETAFVKLAWLLSNYSKEEAALLMEKNLKGEISDRLTESMYLN